MKLPVMGKGITLNELPDEVAVYFEIGDCKQQCKGCHSPHLWEHDGVEWLDLEEIKAYIKTQRGATAVLFMGGTTNYGIEPKDFIENIIKPLSKDYPIGLYHGDSPFYLDKSCLTWIKTGRYIESQGGLTSPTTNQRMYYLVGDEWLDITTYFRKEKI